MATGTEVVALDTPELASLPKSKAEQIRSTFVPMADMLAGFEDDFGEIMALAEEEVTPELSARARRLRLDIRQVRIEAEKLRKALKEEYLLAGRAIDGTNNILKWAISQKEDALQAIEKHEERMEAERLRRLQEERVEALAPYVEDADERDLASMETDVWDAYLAAKKQEHEDRLEAERKAEAERKERERIAALDRKRTREAAPYYDFLPEDVRDALGSLDEDAYSEILAAATKAKKKHEAEQEKIRKERERLKREAEEERERREALEAAERERAEKEKAEAEARAKAEAEAAKAPVKKRLGEWVASFELPDVPGDDHDAAQEIRYRFASFCEWASGRVEEI